MSDHPLHKDYYEEWETYQDKQENLVVRPGKEILLARDREINKPGFMHFWYVLLEGRDVSFIFSLERNWKWEMTIDDLINFGHNFKLQGLPFLSRSDTENNIYAVTFDPPRPVPFTADLKVRIKNINKNDNLTIRKANLIRSHRKIDKQFTDPLKGLAEAEGVEDTASPFAGLDEEYTEEYE